MLGEGCYPNPDPNPDPNLALALTLTDPNPDPNPNPLTRCGESLSSSEGVNFMATDPVSG